MVWQSRESSPGEAQERWVRESGPVCAGGAGRVAGQWPMGERAKEKLGGGHPEKRKETG